MPTKPYPWKCRTCKERAVRPVTVDYTTERDHDGRTYRLTLPDLEVIRCGECGSIVLGDEASEKVSDALRVAAGLMMPAAIRCAREALRLTQAQLAAFLRVSEGSISRWETGAQIQQRGMDSLLRGFFDVPEFRQYLGYHDPDRVGVVSASQRVEAFVEFPGVFGGRGLTTASAVG